MKRSFFVFTVLIVVVLAMSACGSATSPTPTVSPTVSPLLPSPLSAAYASFPPLEGHVYFDVEYVSSDVVIYKVKGSNGDLLEAPSVVRQELGRKLCNQAGKMVFEAHEGLQVHFWFAESMIFDCVYRDGVWQVGLWGKG